MHLARRRRLTAADKESERARRRGRASETKRKSEGEREREIKRGGGGERSARFSGTGRESSCFQAGWSSGGLAAIQSRCDRRVARTCRRGEEEQGKEEGERKRERKKGESRWRTSDRLAREGI